MLVDSLPLEALAECCGFSPEGGSHDHYRATFAGRSDLGQSLRLSWMPKVTKGFFMGIPQHSRVEGQSNRAPMIFAEPHPISKRNTPRQLNTPIAPAASSIVTQLVSQRAVEKRYRKN
jgi:hypothetical protein